MDSVELRIRISSLPNDSSAIWLNMSPSPEPTLVEVLPARNTHHSGQLSILCKDADGVQEFLVHAASVEDLYLCCVVKSSSDDLKQGRVFLLPSDFEGVRGVCKRPIIGVDFALVGHLRFEYVLLKPHPQASTLFANVPRHDTYLRPRELIGHRGLGKTTMTGVAENTLLSFSLAKKIGNCRFVEFDVQLTSDAVPVLYHDFQVCDTVSDELTPCRPHPSINMLSLNAFKKLRPKSRRRLLEQDAAPAAPSGLARSRSVDDLQSAPPGDASPYELDIPSSIFGFLQDSFPTLHEALTFLPSSLGFLVEIKYPTLKQKRERRITFPERNLFVDTILSTLFRDIGSRKVMFLSFDPEICALLSTKQTACPVMFLTAAELMKDEVTDIRRCSFPHSVAFASSLGLAGLVCNAKLIIEEPSKAQLAKSALPLLLTYGVENSDHALVRLQYETLGVDSCICDNVHRVARQFGLRL